MYSNQNNLSILIAINKNIQLNDSDKDEIYPLIREIITYASIARREGLLAIENIQTGYPMLEKGIKLIASGTDPIIIEQIMSKLILSGNYSGKELVLRLIIMDGVFGIQHGENPVRLHDVLTAWLGESFVFEDEESADDSQILKIIESVQSRIQNE